MQHILKLIKDHKSIAMLAPTFPIDFRYPAIIGMLRSLGFDKVTELTFGAKVVNQHYIEYIKSHPSQKYFISTPCPIITETIKNKYPDLVQYLIPVVSPMIATAKIYRKYHPDDKIFFISPCLAKKTIEAQKYSQYIDGVITFDELRKIFADNNIIESNFNRSYFFDSYIQEFTKIYPISGGLAATSHIQKLFKPDEIAIIDGIDNLKIEFDLMKSGKNKHCFFDVLSCPGGCIGGPAICNHSLAIGKKKELIGKYIKQSSGHKLGSHLEDVSHTKDINFFNY